MPSSYALGSHFEDFMNQLIKQGRYNSKSEILRDGLRAIEDKERQRIVKLEALKAALAKGINSGPGLSPETIREQLTSKYSDMETRYRREN